MVACAPVMAQPAAQGPARLGAGVATPGFTLARVDAARGIGVDTPWNGLGWGIVAADYDDDGDIDLFVPTGPGAASRLYRNDGAGHFQDVAQAAGLGDDGPVRVALLFDADGDVDLDLLTAGDRIEGGAPLETMLRFYEQQPDHTFVETTLAAGLFGVPSDGSGVHMGGLCAGDFDADGDPDLFVARWDGRPLMYLNAGDGTFADASDRIGFDYGSLWQPVSHDFDGDGFADLFLAEDFFANHLLLSGPGAFCVDVAPQAGVDSAFNEMGVAVGDYDNDQDFDLYVTNIHGFDVGSGELEHNVLFRNDSGADLAFTELGLALGVGEGGTGWGTTFFDADHDGDVDLLEVNAVEFFGNVPWRLYLNGLGTRGPAFVDVAARVGFDRGEYGSGAVSFDMDRDGDPDVAVRTDQGEVLLFENRQRSATAARGWLVVRPRMGGANSRAIGAVVRVEAGGRVMSRLITAGVSFMGQEPAEAHFGLGGAAVVDRVTVEWPGGGVSEVLGVAPGQVLDVQAP